MPVRHCSWGSCNSDSCYSDREHMKGVFFLKFPPLSKDPERCEKWVKACGREDFTTASLNRCKCICSKHFVGGSGPTQLHPDPLAANLHQSEVQKEAHRRKNTKRRSLKGLLDEPHRSMEDGTPPKKASSTIADDSSKLILCILEAAFNSYILYILYTEL